MRHTNRAATRRLRDGRRHHTRLIHRLAVVAAVIIAAGCGASERKAQTVPIVSHPSAPTTSASLPTPPTASAPQTPTTTSTTPTASNQTNPPQTAAPAPTDAPTSSAAAETTAVIAAEQALPSVDDLPDGWIISPPSTHKDDQQSCSDIALANAGVGAADVNTPTEATRQYQQSTFGPFLAVSINAANDTFNDAVFDQLPNVLASCDGVAESDGTVWHYLPVDLTAIGKRSFAFRMHADNALAPVDVVAVLALDHGHVVGVVHAVLGGAASPDFVENVVRTVLNRL
jgi:hypothetical protein